MIDRVFLDELENCPCRSATFDGRFEHCFGVQITFLESVSSLGTQRLTPIHGLLEQRLIVISAVEVGVEARSRVDDVEHGDSITAVSFERKVQSLPRLLRAVDRDQDVVHRSVIHD